MHDWPPGVVQARHELSIEFFSTDTLSSTHVGEAPSPTAQRAILRSHLA